MFDSIHHAKPRLEFIPQRFNRFVLKLAHIFLPVLLRFRVRPWLPAGISQVSVANAKTLVDLYQQFQSGKIRLLMAFRHPEVDDPVCMMYLLSRSVPQAARQLGIRLQKPFHSHFVYDRGMTIWAGEWLGLFFSRLGGIPIHRGKRLDRVALRTARDLFVNGKMPISVAPEGATNGHSEIVSPLEPGVAQLGFWCVEDLVKANRPETVLIVPIGIKYSYIQPPWSKLDWLLSKLEADSGLISPLKEGDIKSSVQKPEEIFYPRLLRLAEHLLTQMEEFYRRFYHQNIAESDPNGSPNQILIARLQVLLDTALRVAEQYFDLQPQGNIIDRCRRVEEVGWNCIYREDISDMNAISPLHRGMADWVAAEAKMRMRHMRLVESFVSVTATYVQEKPTVERFAETTLIIFDTIARIQGKKSPRRPHLGWRQATLTVGEPISVTERWPLDESDKPTVGLRDRLKARKAVNDLTNDIQMSLEKLI
ncbi:MAG: 1-acyl-sn-glycerol-3-phosphate acyltransferase [Cyanomargarita calcarea GSE-NOS-MK-12-04C]|uniref:1-acyl-sn-glycerol-3-phosphate acyltransferase n=1 Tax=Cyanomargarita calcarea GSE-NOS-MK-12-04C TaxID=2839659 RepID=A0A951QNU7_9CYAN|nr:1-acyl-sn-glycerol-3-phosphate acyltransferase [Cyanomargarita calcarea GSE-NOS-MK-12-04C]